MTANASEMRSSDETVGKSTDMTLSMEMPSICDLSIVIFFRSSRSFTAIEFTSVDSTSEGDVIMVRQKMSRCYERHPSDFEFRRENGVCAGSGAAGLTDPTRV